MLQAELFRTVFTRWNLAYLDRVPDERAFIGKSALILFLLSRFADDWRNTAALREACSILGDGAGMAHADHPDFAFETRILRHLLWFGLVERLRADNDDWRTPRLWRKTALFDRFVRFEP